MNMAPTLDPTSAEEPELRRWLAELPCPEAEAEAIYNAQACYPSPTQHKNCDVCQDTGVAFPWASEPCAYANATQHFVQGRGLTMEALERQESVHASGEWPDRCNSFGRVPKDVTPWEVTTAACLADDVEYVVFVRPRGKGAWVVRLEDCDGTPLVIGSGETPELAVLRAVAAKVVVEQ